MKSLINIPNLITLSRIILLIPYLILINMDDWKLLLIALILLIIAGLSDYLDGYLARKLDKLTEFGKFFDPLADKIVILSVLVGFMIFYTNLIPFWMVILLLIRELAISDFRLFSYSSKKSFRTAILAKLKTALLFASIVISNLYIMIDSYYNTTLEIGPLKDIYPIWGSIFFYIPSIILLIAIYFAYHSGIVYLTSSIGFFYKEH
jgi:CDP-diacylglycerol--glycerol-3-phosphate 3-phosphatidyltransferase